MRSHVTTSLVSQGVPAGLAAKEATAISQAQGGNGSVQSIPHFVRLDFAYATRSVLLGMALAMGAAAVVGMIGLRRGVQEETEAQVGDPGLEGRAEAAGT